MANFMSIVARYRWELKLRDPQVTTGAAGIVIVKVACPVEARAASHTFRAWCGVHDLACAACNADAAYCACVRVVVAGVGVGNLKGCDSKNRGNRGWSAVR